jgi:hypothetical protein
MYKHGLRNYKVWPVRDTGLGWQLILDYAFLLSLLLSMNVVKNLLISVQNALG